MSITITYYSILGVKETATPEEIKKAYRSKARSQHPDLLRQNGMPADETTFKLINEAYKVLSDEQSRKDYDSSLRKDAEPEPEPEPTWGEESEWGEEEVWGEETVEEPVSEPEEEYIEADVVEDDDEVDDDWGNTADNDSIPIRNFNRTYDWEQNIPQTKRTVTPAQKPTKIFLPVSLGMIVLMWAIYLIFMLVSEQTKDTLPITIAVGILSAPTLLASIPPKAYHKVFILRALRGVVYGVAGIITIGFIIIVPTLSFAVAPAVIGWVAMRMFAKSKYGSGIIPEAYIESRTWGTAGDLTDAVSKFGYKDVNAGIKGEKATAVLLEDFVNKLGTATVFHGLEFPTTSVSKADVDHAVLYGNKLALIDSKMWKPAYYQFGPGVIEVHDFNGGTQVRETNFPTAVERYAKLYPNLEVFGWYFIHSKSSKRDVEIGDYNKLGSTYMTTAEAGMESVGAWLLDDKTKKKNTIDRKTIYSLATHLK